MTDHQKAPGIVRLSRGGVVCRVLPELGGALLSLDVDNVQILRPSPAAPTDILKTASFPLVPFANRIAGGRFHFENRQIELPADVATPPHAHHGHGWRRPWQIVTAGHDFAEMEFVHVSGAWPWTYRATQSLKLIGDGLELALAVANLSDRSMPCGFGIHPYFDMAPDSYLTVCAPRRLCTDERGIATRLARGLSGKHLISELPLSDDLLLDESGKVLVGTSAWEAMLTASAAAGWQFYIPPARTFFCLEPVSHRPDSFNLPGPIETLAPGTSRDWCCTIRRIR